FFKMQWYSKQQGEFQEEIILSIVEMLSIHDEYTTNHSQKVAQLASRLGEEMGLSRKEIKDCYWSGLIHDIGKTLIPARILNKKGPLTKDEYEQIKKHPVWGYQTIKKSSRLQELAEYVLYHHENWDGSGYPTGLEKEEIPLISQILQVSDSWDAMTSDRSYREALTRGEAVAELKENSGTQFAPEVVKAMLKLIVTQEVK
ncbi:MAG: HD-GYP domain-containing protein, partial [Halanaerobiaceae bacterium]